MVDSDPEIQRYTHKKEEETVTVVQPTAVVKILAAVDKCIDTPLTFLRSRGAWLQHTGGNMHTYAFTALKALETWKKHPRYEQAQYFDGHFHLLASLFALKGGVQSHGVGSGVDWVREFDYKKAKSGVAQKFKESPPFLELKRVLSLAVENSQNSQVSARIKQGERSTKYKSTQPHTN